MVCGNIFTNLHSQTVRARELKFGEKVHLSIPVMCQVSHVTCHMSRVTCCVSPITCHMSSVRFFFLDKVVKLVRGGSVINGAYPV